MKRTKHLAEYKTAIRTAQKAVTKTERLYRVVIQELVNAYGVELATGQMSDVWQASEDQGQSWQSEWDDDPKPLILDDVHDLGVFAEDFHIGPTNLERFKPKKVKKGG